jgi:hypothetical protein
MSGARSTPSGRRCLAQESSAWTRSLGSVSQGVTWLKTTACPLCAENDCLPSIGTIDAANRVSKTAGRILAISSCLFDWASSVRGQGL